MGFWKYGAKKQIVKTYENLNELIDDLESKGFSSFRRRIASIEPIKLDPERYLYIRNHSVSGMEWHGPNENGDGFPYYDELQPNHLSFIGSRISVDHQDDIIVGMVLDSVLMPPHFNKNEIFVEGGHVENILALDKKMVETSKFPDLIEWIGKGEVTDSSMGANVVKTICSICGNIAYSEDEYCSHIIPENGFKNSIIKTSSGEDKLCYEVCRGVTFFEDAIIVPLRLGGLAGGEGADTQAKILEKVASQYPLMNYIVDRKKQIKIANEEIKKDDNDLYSSALDYIFVELKKGSSFKEAMESAVEAFHLDSEIFKKEVYSSYKKVYVIPFGEYGRYIEKIGNYNKVIMNNEILMLSDEEIA